MTFESNNRLWRPIFSTTFNDEQTVRKGGWKPTNVSFENWKAIGNWSDGIITYKRKIPNWNFTVKCNFEVGSNLGSIFSQYIGATTGRFAMYYSAWDSTWRIIYDGTTRDFTATNWDIGKAIITRTWNDVQLYINGVSILTAISSVNNVTDNDFEVLGNATLGYADSKVDLIEIYNTAWTAEQVANDYNWVTFLDYREGLILDVDSRQGIAEDKFWNEFTWGAEIKRANNQYNQYQTNTSETLITENILRESANITLCWWYKFENIIDSMWMIQQRDNRRNDQVQLVLFQWNIYFAVFDGTGWVEFALIGTWFDQPKFYFICWTCDGTYIKLYIGWILVNTVSLTITPNITNYEIRFGSAWNGSMPYLWYKNQERIYSKALSAAEVMQLYTSQAQFYLT